jgi:filamentous hemagglutinin family protein
VLGRQAGPNLFHSFADFQLNAGEFANFTGPAAIQNILVRVTGPNPSLLGGGLSSGIAGANLVFMNPHGITFSSGASLTLDGSFLATTADYLRFGDGATFPARPVAGTPVFSAEPLVGVGFLAAEFAARGRNAPVTLDDPDFDGVSLPPSFQLSPGRSFIVAGGEVTVDHRSITAPGGAVALLALHGAGEVALNLGDPHAAISTDAFANQAALTLRNSTAINVDGGQAGRVTLRGRDILLDSASIQAQSSTVDSDVAIDVKGTRSVTLNNSASMTALVFGSARGGDLWVEAPRVTLANFSALRTDTYPGSTGDGGALLVRAQTIAVSGTLSLIHI